MTEAHRLARTLLALAQGTLEDLALRSPFLYRIPADRLSEVLRYLEAMEQLEELQIPKLKRLIRASERPQAPTEDAEEETESS